MNFVLNHYKLTGGENGIFIAWDLDRVC